MSKVKDVYNPMKPITRKNRPPETVHKEHNSGEKKVETAGYRTSTVQIESLIQAGRDLNQFRKENYDFQEGEPYDDNYQIPDRAPNFDLADASALAEETSAKLEAQANDEKARKSRDKKAKDEKAKKDADELAALKAEKLAKDPS